MCLRERPRSLTSSLIGLKTLVATTTLSRLTPHVRRVLPSTTSLSPREYTSAVSKKLIPASLLRLLQATRQLLAGRDERFGQTQVEEDHREQIVKIMGNAA